MFFLAEARGERLVLAATQREMLVLAEARGERLGLCDGAFTRLFLGY